MDKTVQKVAKSKYDVERVGITGENGEVNSYSRCSICGEWHKGQFGVELDFCVPSEDDGRYTTSYAMVKKLCRDCAKEINRDILRFADKLSGKTNLAQKGAERRCGSLNFG